MLAISPLMPGVFPDYPAPVVRTVIQSEVPRLVALLGWGLQARRTFQPSVNTGRHFGFMGLLKKAIPLFARRQLRSFFSCFTGFLDQALAQRSILFEPVAFHLNV